MVYDLADTCDLRGCYSLVVYQCPGVLGFLGLEFIVSGV